MAAELEEGFERSRAAGRKFLIFFSRSRESLARTGFSRSLKRIVREVQNTSSSYSASAHLLPSRRSACRSFVLVDDSSLCTPLSSCRRGRCRGESALQSGRARRGERTHLEQVGARLLLAPLRIGELLLEVGDLPAQLLDLVGVAAARGRRRGGGGRRRALLLLLSKRELVEELRLVGLELALLGSGLLERLGEAAREGASGSSPSSM